MHSSTMRARSGERRVALVSCRALPDLTADDRLLLEPLREAGINGRPAVWDDPRVDWASFDCAVLRSTWDYHVRPAEFEHWIRRCEAAGVRLWNPAPLLRWNLHKRYLRQLAELGIDVVPTVWLERGSEADLQQLMATSGWERAVVKPAISAGARRTWLVGREEAAARQPALNALLARSDVLVQRFLDSVLAEGEWSFVFLGGPFSHAVLKRPAPGDFRVQERFGGVIARADAGPVMVRQAESILEAAVLARRSDLPGAAAASANESEGPGPLYARVDAVRERERLLLVELEILEPSLFLALDSLAPGRLATAIAARLA